MITLPLLIITSASGVVAALNLPSIVGIIIGATSAVLTAIQRYCAYSERAENARMTAKSYSKILNEINNMKLHMHSKILSCKVSHDMLAKFLTDIQNHSNSTRETALEIPWQILKTDSNIEKV
jgi:hypothetical protein